MNVHTVESVAVTSNQLREGSNCSVREVPSLNWTASASNCSIQRESSSVTYIMSYRLLHDVQFDFMAARLEMDKLERRTCF